MSNRDLYQSFIGTPGESEAKIRKLTLNREVVARRGVLQKMVERAERQLTGIESRLEKRRLAIEAKLALPNATEDVKERLVHSLELAAITSDAETARLKAEIADFQYQLKKLKIV
jgi:hypothetical protein